MNIEHDMEVERGDRREVSSKRESGRKRVAAAVDDAAVAQHERQDPLEPQDMEGDGDLRKASNDERDVDRYRAPALDKGLDILELLAEQKEGLTRAEITKRLNRNANEMYRVLERLVMRQYVVRSAGGDRYALSLKLYALAHRHSPTNRLIAEALPVMHRFADSAEQSCHLAVYDRGSLLVIAQVDGPGSWGISVRLGARIGLLDTGSGRVMLAFQRAEQREHMLAEHHKVKGEASRDLQMLERVYQQIQRDGFSQKDSQQTVAVTDVTFPLFGPSGQAIATLTCPYLRRIDEYASPTLDAATALLKTAASSLSMLPDTGEGAAL